MKQSVCLLQLDGLKTPDPRYAPEEFVHTASQMKLNSAQYLKLWIMLLLLLPLISAIYSGKTPEVGKGRHLRSAAASRCIIVARYTIGTRLILRHRGGAVPPEKQMPEDVSVSTATVAGPAPQSNVEA